MIDTDRFAAVLAGIAQTLITEYGIADVLHDLCDDLSDLLGVTGAGVMVRDDDDVLRFAAASDGRAAVLEPLQERLGEGPCLMAYQHGDVVIDRDLTHAPGYERFAAEALEENIAAVAAFPLQVHDQRVGALTLYRDTPGGLHAAQAEAARTLAASAAAFVLNAKALDEATTLNDHLRRALSSRVVIEQAKGKLSERLTCEVDVAFELLRRHARNHGARLHDIADEVLAGRLELALQPTGTPTESPADAAGSGTAHE